MAVLMPITFGMDSTTALVLLVSIYLGGMFGGRISAILLNIPGDASSVVSTFDGYPIARSGRAGYALTLSAVASFTGGVIGFIGLALLAQPLARYALLFGPAENFILIVFVLIVTSGVTGSTLLKSIISVCLGLLVACVGMDTVTGDSRFTFGMVDLWDGVDLVVVAIGMFGVSEVIARLRSGRVETAGSRISLRELLPAPATVIRYASSMGRGGLIGFIVGILPGVGASAATFIAYAGEKGIAKDTSRFGRGEPRGLAAPEAADNGSVGGALVPTLSLGIPGSASGALILAGMIMSGLQPGPGLFQDSGPLVWTIIATVLVANVLLLVINVVMVPAFAAAIRVLEPFLTAVITALCFVGVFSLRGSFFDVCLMLGFGVVGYFLRDAGFPPAGVLLGVILGPLLEENFRRAMLASHGDVAVFVSSPVAVVLVGITVVSLALFAVTPVMKRRAARKIVADHDGEEQGVVVPAGSGNSDEARPRVGGIDS
jgi:putative tricarboxylic transport membrane protein